MIKPLTLELYAPLWNDLPGSESRSYEPLLSPRLPRLTTPLSAANSNALDLASYEHDEDDQQLTG